MTHPHTALLDYSADVAGRLRGYSARTARGAWVVRAATALHAARPIPQGDAPRPAGPAADFIDHAAATVHQRTPTLPPGLWSRLMCDWPMGVYAAHAAAKVRELHTPGDRVLEIGAGVGNTTRLLPDTIIEGATLTDLHPSIIRPRPGTTRVRFDIDLPPSLDDGYGLAFGTNVVHCARDRHAALMHTGACLRPGGHLTITEGTPTVADAPWALHWAFGLMDGWWDVGGFESADYWSAMTPPNLNLLAVDRVYDGARHVGNTLTWKRAR